jgi:putative ABC transport system permease protein
LLALSDGYFDAARFGTWWYLEGDPARAAAALREGTGVAISAALSDRFGLHVGDRLTLDTPTGPVAVDVAGVVRDYMSDRGTVILRRQLLVERWKETAVNRFNVSLAVGESAEAVRRRIADRLGDRFALKVLLPREVLAYQGAAIDRAFMFTDAIQLLIVFVTVAGIFDLLLATIWERRRELALWRVVGADEAAVRRTVVIESATIGAFGAVLGGAVGLVTAWIWIRINFPHLLGFYLEYHFALGATAWYVALTLFMTMIAGYGAARYATRQPVLDGIQIE